MVDPDGRSDQCPLLHPDLDRTIKQLLGVRNWHTIVTHGPSGAHSRNRYHDEICDSVVRLWETGHIHCRKLWMFAFEDGNGRHLPRARKNADIYDKLDNSAWNEKYRLITEVYGSGPDSWEARTTPREEAFQIFITPSDARGFISNCTDPQP